MANGLDLSQFSAAGLGGGMEPGGGGSFFQNLGSTFSDLAKDRNFLSLLAGIGTGLDPEGVGGAIGKPTIGYLQSKAAQEATAKSTGQRQKFNEMLIKMLGGMTPKDQEGLTSLKAGPDNVTLDITTPGGQQAVEGATATPAAPTATPATPEAAGINLSDIIPFL